MHATRAVLFCSCSKAVGNACVGVMAGARSPAGRVGSVSLLEARPIAKARHQDLRRRASLLLVFAPTLLAALYFGLVATDRYVSEAQFVVRTAAKPIGGASLGAILQMAGVGRAQDDMYSVQSFMTSRNAVDQLAERIPVREIYGHPDADPLARFPSIFYGNTAEELDKYLGWMITTDSDTTTGITTLRVQAFRAEEAQQLSLALLELGEETINQMNARIRADALQTAQAEVKRNEERLIAAQVAITRFRNSELMIDPAGSSIVVTELIARLSADLAQVEAQIREITSSAATNPQLPSLQRRAEALQAQVLHERQRISSENEGLADKLAIYERLVLEREFAKEALSAAVRMLELANQEARRQQLYLERLVEPMVADRPMAPERLRLFATALGLNLIFALVAWLLYSGLREHAAEASR